MTKAREIRAVYDEESIRVYQAFSSHIAEPAVENRTFVAPFSMTRMTWIKPSFLWMMYRCGWAQKDQAQKRVLAIDIKREGFHWALRNACLAKESKEFEIKPPVRIQWDPERDLDLNRLDHRSIQIGLSGEAVERYVRDWIVGISDITSEVIGLKAALDAGRREEALARLPVERPYPTPDDIVESLFR